MWSTATAAQWRQLADEVCTGMQEWRLQHPKATLTEIERALDERLARMRARMLEDAALASAATDLRGLPAEDRPHCPDCGQVMQLRGPEVRQLTTTYEQQVTLRRHYAVCPACDEAVFPPG